MLLKRINLLHLLFLLFTVLVPSTVASGLENEDYELIATTGTIKYEVPRPKDVYYGFECSIAEFIYKKFTSEHFTKIRQWGFNCLLVTVWWSEYVEPDEDAVGVYDEGNLQALRNSVDLALNEGLKVILSGRVCFDPAEEVGWDGWATHDYVNMQDEGLNRYAKFWEMVAQRFPDCMYCLWHFPYHMQSVDSTRKNRFYSVTLPTLISAVRKHSNNTIVFVPIHQGATKNGETANYYLTANPIDDQNIIYGLGHMMPWNVVDYGDWDYNTERLDEAFAGVKRWTETLNLPMMSVEYSPLRWVRGEPIEESRLACLNESLKRMRMYEAGWMYWRLSSLQEGGDNILGDIDNFEPNISIFTLLQEWK